MTDPTTETIFSPHPPPCPDGMLEHEAPRGARGSAPALTRRGLLLAAAAAPLLAAPDWLATLARRVQDLGGQPGWPGLLRSYDVEPEAGAAFDRTHAGCAYVYDNAVAGLALLAGGEVSAARRLGEALVAAQARDRFWTDGRLRNAYASGVVAATGAYPLPGWWDRAQNRWMEDSYQVSTATGVVAWVCLLWMALHRVTGQAAFRVAAGRAGDWIERAARVPAGYSGGYLGWEPSPARLGWVSTEHNLDCAVAFAALGRQAGADHARRFVASMWRADEGRFDAGLTPAGAPDPFSAADANIWPLLAPGAQKGWAVARDGVMARHGVPQAAPQGVDFNTDRDGIWLEGTAYVALAARLAGDTGLAGRMMQTLRAQTSAAGLVFASSVPRLTTGLAIGLGQTADLLYNRRGHVGATAWAALAQMGANPFILP